MEKVNKRKRRHREAMDLVSGDELKRIVEVIERYMKEALDSMPKSSRRLLIECYRLEVEGHDPPQSETVHMERSSPELRSARLQFNRLLEGLIQQEVEHEKEIEHALAFLQGRATSSRNSAVGLVKRADEVTRTAVAAGTATETQVLLGPDDGMPHFAMRRFTMGEGGGIPRHTNAVEHEQYVLRGRARITVGDEVHEVAADDVVYIPAGVPHSYRVLEAPFEFLCVVPNAPDRIEILEEAC